MSADDLSLSLPELVGALRTGRIRARDLAARARARAEANRYQAYREIRGEAALAEADAADAAFAAGRDPGPLAGIPISVKDLYGLPGSKTFAGSSEALPASFEQSGPVLNRALRQLAVVIGKTHTVEFAFGGIGANAHWGTPRNPHCDHEHRVPGGSSSGAGPSLYEGSARVAFGTDTAGSVRIPAAWSGQAALKTTKGRWSTEGIVPLSSSLDTAGILARTVEDLAFAFFALDPSDRQHTRTTAGLRLGFAEGLFRENCSPGVLEAVERALSDLNRDGAQVVDVSLPGLDAAKSVFDVGGPTAVEIHQFLSSTLPEWLPRLEDRVRTRVQGGGGLLAGEYIRRQIALREAHSQAMTAFHTLDAVVTPTVANSPPLASDMDDNPELYRQENLLCLRNTGMVSMLGLCAVSLPCGRDTLGLPVGLQLIGPAYAEEALLATALAVESTLGPRL